MGDRTYTTIRFSGSLHRSKVPELIEALEAENVLSSNDEKPARADNLADTFYDCECNYGQMESAEGTARDLGLSYLKEWQPGGDYGPGMLIYVALLDQEFECPTCGGEPVVGVSELLKKPVEEIVPYLQMFVDFDSKFPPLEIID